MEHIKASTKRGQSIIARAKYVKGYTLEDVYNKPSDTKKSIFNDWWFFCKQNNMRNLHICSANCMMFSLGFEDDSHVYYITKEHNYCVDLNA